jgi:XTP/dITP diphosphohydrolase
MGTRGATNHLVVATTNRGKLEELRALLAGLDIAVLGVADVLRDPPIIVEDGATFADNAIKKARAIAQATMMLSLADDSGLEVDALDGRPGVHSARFAHERATDAENNAALLSALDELGDRAHDPSVSRARFRCVLALVDPFTDDGAPLLSEGACEGSITRTPRGAGGFGYDPLFVVEGGERTLAELSEDEKNAISHRARAFAAMKPLLERVLAGRAQVVANVIRGAVP